MAFRSFSIGFSRDFDRLSKASRVAGDFELWRNMTVGVRSKGAY